MSEKKKILIVDDEKELVALVSLHIKMLGYDVLSCDDGEKALKISERESPALIILDLMLPKIDGWEVCKRLRETQKTKDIPVIMLTCRAETEDKLKGFEVGADDYVTKPFSPRELVVRVKRVLARAETKSSLHRIIRIGSLEINLEDMGLKRNNQEILLTDKEKGILRCLINNSERVLTHSEILDEVWGQDNIVEYGNIDVHISRLREKLEKDPENPQLIKTVKGEGYKFEL
jgi:two-component system alkaline phosphatase synthesis response regulator PhoP